MPIIKRYETLAREILTDEEIANIEQEIANIEPEIANIEQEIANIEQEIANTEPEKENKNKIKEDDTNKEDIMKPSEIAELIIFT